MRDDGSPGAGDILAGGAGRGVALEEFGPIWNSARLRLGRASWGTSGLEPFLTHAVPYTGTSSGRLSEDAVRVFLASAGQRDDYRVLELGAGSGVFAKLFLDHLRNLAPDVYDRTTYVVTDASQTMLAAQDAHALLDPHTARVERYVLDATCDIPPTGDFDAVLGTYVLDSLPFDLLAVKDGRVWRKEACTAVEGSVCDDPGGLIAALRDDDPAALAEWQWIAPHLALQTRHTEVNRAELSFGNSLPTDTGAETMPYVHCYGALACIEASLRALRPGGVAIFSDYGHLAPLPRYEFLEFQTYGNSVAVGVNFFQLTAAFENWTGAVLYRPAKDAGVIAAIGVVGEHRQANGRREGDGCSNECELQRVMEVAIGEFHMCARLRDGQVRCWGANTRGQLGYGHKDRIGDSETPSHAGDIAIFAPSAAKKL